MKVVYVIGPYRSRNPWEVLQNVQRAEQLGAEVVKLGAMPIITQKITEGINCLADDDFWTEGTKELLRRSDAAITVEAIGYSWRDSIGSVGEVKEMGDVLVRPVFHELNHLRLWLSGQYGRQDKETSK